MTEAYAWATNLFAAAGDFERVRAGLAAFSARLAVRLEPAQAYATTVAVLSGSESGPGAPVVLPDRLRRAVREALRAELARYPGDPLLGTWPARYRRRSRTAEPHLATSGSGFQEQAPERCGSRPERRPQAPHNQKIPRPARAGEPRGHDPPIPRQDRVPRHQRHPEARGDCLTNRLGASELHPRCEGHAPPREIAFAHAAGARAFLASDVGLARDRVRGHGPASRQRVAAWDDEHQLVLHPGFRS